MNWMIDELRLDRLWLSKDTRLRFSRLDLNRMKKTVSVCSGALGPYSLRYVVSLEVVWFRALAHLTWFGEITRTFRPPIKTAVLPLFHA